MKELPLNKTSLSRTRIHIIDLEMLSKYGSSLTNNLICLGHSFPSARTHHLHETTPFDSVEEDYKKEEMIHKLFYKQGEFSK